MTHAFFKALLFMAAGSIIGAMAGEQSLDRMGGFRKALPFTFVCFIVGGLALAGIPPFSGFFSKDEILAFEAERGGWHWIALRRRLRRRVPDRDLHVPDDLPRLLRRAVPGGARARGRATSPTREPFNPATGEEEDTDVGFPGPEHHIAERELPDEGRDGARSRSGASIGGLIQIPHVDDVLDDVPRADASRLALHATHRADGRLSGSGSCVGALLSACSASRSPTASGCAARARRRASARASPPLHELLRQQVVVRRALSTASSCARSPRSGASPSRPSSAWSSTACSSAARPASCAPARPPCARCQTGFLRYYAALLLLGVAGIASTS